MEHQEVVTEKEYAGIGARFLAIFLDGIIIGIPMYILFFVVTILVFGLDGGTQMLFSETYPEEEISDAEAMAFLGKMILYLILVFVISIGGGIAYYAGMHASKWQATFGKKILGIKVTDLNGQKISFWRSLGRHLSMQFISSIFMIGFIIAFFTERKQSLHDLIAGTIVVKDK
ncbi:RDD family protein [Bacillus sp. IB182487]|uniref:RDD family protein n=1 Tax=Metabacillus arenae TaxID=2771434 RepID=A0A926NNS7_9BACI|nr:RDD family protein [Metabacillus arenae]